LTVALKLDPFAQLKLLDLSDLDRTLAAATHRRATLPALAVIAERTQRAAEVRRAVVMAETDVSDLKRATDRLDMEVDQVRARAKRDADRLQSGQAGAKELENLQREIESLKRRQATLEDEELELMERREDAERVLSTARAELAELTDGIAAATAERDAAFVTIDAELSAGHTRRAELTGALPADVLALYTRIKDSGKTAAGKLTGSQCGACRLDLDRTALAAIHSASPDAIIRCEECGAILVRA
jgi:uncharacterized protein